MISNGEKARRDQTAMELAKAHVDTEESIVRVVRLLDPHNEDAAMEPIKLLEVNTATFPAGILPIYFGPDPEDGLPYPTVIIEVTRDEFARIERGELALPRGLTFGQTLHPIA
jgi:hypothetical protein